MHSSTCNPRLRFATTVDTPISAMPRCYASRLETVEHGHSSHEGRRSPRLPPDIRSLSGSTGS
jgi:hypothetical protein